jgi:hypothetical protein
MNTHKTQKQIDAEIADYILNHSGSILNFAPDKLAITEAY